MIYTWRVCFLDWRGTEQSLLLEKDIRAPTAADAKVMFEVWWHGARQHDFQALASDHPGKRQPDVYTVRTIAVVEPDDRLPFPSEES